MPVETWNMVAIPKRVAKRAAERFEENESGCHLSTYSTGSHGYAQIGWQQAAERHVVLAHRAAWTAANGPVPVGMTLDHICRERRCVNVEHLRLLSNFENGRRNTGVDFPLGQCAHGHGDEHLRTYTRSGGKKSLGCSICRSEMQRRYREKAAA
ncbi:HNH endonuclease signature motif containing protein [Curtobacterium sp. MCBD17_028]|uniref:HNH endonuclease signature motif containing protein n=1 Tax=Curtobacterium sp. MCBD17_028 TaxID=2175670 RepID=UPI000DA9FBB6|nr:HNH endonuclease signature motif containing protein [Curtobacterium sp. MCBD17_028]PZE23874.1 hypothetical protein DEI86_13605 [Curtobacterium sp. MCBD17_028]